MAYDEKVNSLCKKPNSCDNKTFIVFNKNTFISCDIVDNQIIVWDLEWDRHVLSKEHSLLFLFLASSWTYNTLFFCIDKEQGCLVTSMTWSKPCRGI